MPKESEAKALITGGAGFVGSHLIKYLTDRHIDVLATYYMSTISTEERQNLKRIAKFEECDVRQKRELKNLISQFRPTMIFHLASQSFPAESLKEPIYTYETNILGTSNLFESVKELRTQHINPVIINACSSAEYGGVSEHDIPVKENHALRPLHPYGVSKVAQELIAYSHFVNFGTKAVNIRIFNTTGPGKRGDICGDFTEQAIQFQKGNINQFRVGNLDTKRAITDVRDLVEALYLAAQKADYGQHYNVSGSKVYSGREILDIVLKIAKISPKVFVDKELFRPNDEKVIFGNSSKFKERTGWEQQISLKQTIADMLSHFKWTLK